MNRSADELLDHPDFRQWGPLHQELRRAVVEESLSRARAVFDALDRGDLRLDEAVWSIEAALHPAVVETLKKSIYP